MCTMSTIDAKYYDREDIWKGYKNNKHELERAKKTLSLIPNDSNIVLDIGCGIGSLTNHIDKPLVLGMDFVKTPLKHVRKSPLQGSIAALPIKHDKIDLTVITEVLEHLDDNIYNDAIKEINILKPKYLIISVPYNQCLEYGLCKCEKCGAIFHVAHHVRSFDTNTIVKTFDNYDLIKVLYLGNTVVPDATLLKLKQKFGYYYYSDTSICDKCGGMPINQKFFAKKVFDLVSFLVNSLVKKHFLKIRQPTHQIILLKRRA